MTGSSTLDPDSYPLTPGQSQGRGHGIGSLGPSDTSDSGSDVMGARKDQSGAEETGVPQGTPVEEDHSTDSQGTGECASIEPGGGAAAGADIDVDRIDALNGD